MNGRYSELRDLRARADDYLGAAFTAYGEDPGGGQGAGGRLRRLLETELELRQLSEMASPTTLLIRTAELVAGAAGFQRALTATVSGSRYRSVAQCSAATERRDSAIWLSTSSAMPLQEDAREAARRKLVVKTGGPRPYLLGPVSSGGEVIALIRAHRGEEGVEPFDFIVLDRICQAVGQSISTLELNSRIARHRQSLVSSLKLLDGEPGAHLLAGRGPQTSPAAIGPGQAEWPEAQLTRREAEVLRAMSTGMANRQIAERLVITEATVKSHVKRILRKLGAANRSQAVAIHLSSPPGSGEPQGPA